MADTAAPPATKPKVAPPPPPPPITDGFDLRNTIPDLVGALRAVRVKVMGPVEFVNGWFHYSQSAQINMRAMWPATADTEMPNYIRDIVYPAYVRSLVILRTAYPNLD